jgi:hypothetical protein
MWSARGGCGLRVLPNITSVAGDENARTTDREAAIWLIAPEAAGRLTAQTELPLRAARRCFALPMAWRLWRGLRSFPGRPCTRANRPYGTSAALAGDVRSTCAPCKGGAFQWVQAPPGNRTVFPRPPFFGSGNRPRSREKMMGSHHLFFHVPAQHGNRHKSRCVLEKRRTPFARGRQAVAGGQGEVVDGKSAALGAARQPIMAAAQSARFLASVALAAFRCLSLLARERTEHRVATGRNETLPTTRAHLSALSPATGAPLPLRATARTHHQPGARRHGQTAAQTNDRRLVHSPRRCDIRSAALRLAGKGVGLLPLIRNAGQSRRAEGTVRLSAR